MKLRDVVRGAPETISTAASLHTAANAMVSADMGSMAVVTDGQLIGILTERDILEAVASGIDMDQATVGNHMTAHPDVFSPHTDVVQVAEWLLETGYRHVPVTDGELIGILSMRDILAAVIDPGRMRALMN